MVSIYGEDYPLVGVTDPAHISRIADIVDSKMSQAAKSSRVKARDKIAILAALSMASELHENGESVLHYQQEFDSRLDGIISRLDRVLAGD